MSRLFSEAVSGQRSQFPAFPGGGMPLAMTIAAWVSPVAYTDSTFQWIAGRGQILASPPHLVSSPVPGLLLFKVGGFKSIVGYMYYTANGAYAYAPYRRADPFDPLLWDFYATSWMPGDGGPRIFSGDAVTPVAEVGSYLIRTAESGSPGLAPPKVVESGGLLVNGDGAYLGDWTIGGPQVGRPFIPATQYGVVPFTGRVAYQTLWGGVLTLAQKDLLRVYPRAARFFATLPGWPELLHSGWLDDTGTTLRDHIDGGVAAEVLGNPGLSEQPDGAGMAISSEAETHLINLLAQAASDVSVQEERQVVRDRPALDLTDRIVTAVLAGASLEDWSDLPV